MDIKNSVGYENAFKVEEAVDDLIMIMYSNLYEDDFEYLKQLEEDLELLATDLYNARKEFDNKRIL